MWSEFREEQLRKYWAEGKLAKECGILLGVSKNAICGKVRRMGLPQRGNITLKKAA